MIVVVVPTVREEKYQEFVKAWAPLFKKYNVHLIKVTDGDVPTANDKSVSEIMGEYEGLIYNKNDGVRNLGFAYVAKYLPQAQCVITLDDDTLPHGDTIADHINTLNRRVPISWMNTADRYMRGVPYAVRTQAEVVLSHGLWHGVKDWDAPTQLVIGNPDVKFYTGPIPRGVLYPMCGMNIAFKRKMLPYMYYAPMGPRVGLDRFADIWCGIESKRVIDAKGWAVYSGGAFVSHDRASNVWKNLQKEAKGLELNETAWLGNDDEYFKLYETARGAWKEFIDKCQSSV